MLLVSRTRMRYFAWMVVVVFCFKQKRAYEMRMSDWSSDVCSSDLAFEEGRLAGTVRADQTAQFALAQLEIHMVDGRHAAEPHGQVAGLEDDVTPGCHAPSPAAAAPPAPAPAAAAAICGRSGRPASANAPSAPRPEERRVGTEWGSTCRT